ncbi:MAG: tRNA 4-thiouridine(8) synthase ThiI [Eubacteriales bacterium]|nr:tRNA 4-thiouridine(8) synthase ThiI [Eubacteriales bacterium]
MEKILLLRYGEIHLKGLNRPFFEHKLVQAIKVAARGFGDTQLEHGQGRFFLSGYDAQREGELIAALRRVFGVHSVSPAAVVASELESVRRGALDVVRAEQSAGGTFKVEARRSNKRYPLNSVQIGADVGGYLLENMQGLSVDVHQPQFRLYVEIRGEKAYLYTHILPGPGGMPLGSAGRAMLLLSGGIDSPVAGYMLMRRGVELEAVYFNSPPHTTERAHLKVKKLAQVLSGYGCPIRLHSVYFTDIQEAIYEKCDTDYMTILMRRFMMRIAQRLALESDCGCLLTGENLGQVASQTMQAMAVTNAVVDLPVFRPLIAHDKTEIVDKAQQIGTFDISIEPYEDCCTVFVPRHPVTKPRLKAVLYEERKLDVEGLIDAALQKSETTLIGGE